MQASGPSSPSPGVLIVESFNEALRSLSTLPSEEAAVRHRMAVQDLRKQLMGMHEKLLKPMTMLKAIEDNNDALLAQLLEFSGKVTNLIDDFNKDFGVMLEKNVKDGLADVKEVPVSAITPAIEQSQTIPLAVSYRQSEVGDKAVNQLDELVNTKLEATIASSAKQVHRRWNHKLETTTLLQDDSDKILRTISYHRCVSRRFPSESSIQVQTIQEFSQNRKEM